MNITTVSPAKLKQARINARLSRQAVGEKTGKTAQYIYQLETGRRRVNLQWMYLLCEIYGVPTDSIIEKAPIPAVATTCQLPSNPATLAALVSLAKAGAKVLETIDP